MVIQKLYKKYLKKFFEVCIHFLSLADGSRKSIYFVISQNIVYFCVEVGERGQFNFEELFTCIGDDSLLI